MEVHLDPQQSNTQTEGWETQRWGLPTGISQPWEVIPSPFDAKFSSIHVSQVLKEHTRAVKFNQGLIDKSLDLKKLH